MAAAVTATGVDAGGSVAEQDPTVLAYEQDVNSAYVANLERRSKGYEIDGVFWRPDIRPGALIGRVRMRHEGDDVDDVDDEFYIGQTVAHLPGPEDTEIELVSIEASSLEEVVRLSEARPKGSVAIITALVRELGSYAKRHGWTEGADHYWSDGNGHRFTLLTSPEARGLEFDAVMVVVEPAAFRALAGDNGPLYTAMTRANLELVIVHERSLTPPMVLHLRTRPHGP